MNKKGFTLMEVMVSVILVSVFMAALCSVVIDLRKTGDSVGVDTDIAVYSSILSRVINYDIAKHGGIMFADCDAAGDECGLILGDNEKRILNIKDVTNNKMAKVNYNSINDVYYTTVGGTYVKQIEVGYKGNNVSKNATTCDNIKANCGKILVSNGGCACTHYSYETTLLYEDISERDTTDLTYHEAGDHNVIYIKTLHLEQEVSLNSANEASKFSSTGYNFLHLKSNEYQYASNEGADYRNNLIRLTLSVYDRIDPDDPTYNVEIYSSSKINTKESRVGEQYVITLGTRNGLSNDEENTLVQPKVATLGDVAITEIVEKYNVGFEASNFRTLEKKSIRKITPPYLSDRTINVENKTFVGYFTEPCAGVKVINSSGKIVVPSNYFKSNTTIYACYVPTPLSVTFDVNGGDIISGTECSRVLGSNASGQCVVARDFGDSYNRLPSVSRTGYTFKGWSLDKGGTKLVNVESTINTASNHKLYAIWD